MKAIIIITASVCIIFSTSSGFSTENGDDDGVLQPLMEKPPSHDDGLSVSLHKDKKKKIPPNFVQLLKPEMNSEVTPGVLRFSWKVRSDINIKKNKLTFVIENLDNGKTASTEVKGEQASVAVKAGNYRWRIISSHGNFKTGWRTFEVAAQVENLASQPEQDTSELEGRVKAAELEAKKAWQLAKIQEAKLKEVRLEKIKEDTLMRERMAKLEADRKNKIKQDKLVYARQANEIRMAKLKVQEFNKNLQLKLKEVQDAKLDAEQAASDLAAKSAELNSSEESVAMETSAPETIRTPASEPEVASPAPQKPPQVYLRSAGDDLQWSDDK